jgi:hypothetical protein
MGKKINSEKSNDIYLFFFFFLVPGKTVIGKWGEAFQKESAAAAESVTPVGAFVLRQHVFR